MTGTLTCEALGRGRYTLVFSAEGGGRREHTATFRAAPAYTKASSDLGVPYATVHDLVRKTPSKKGSIRQEPIEVAGQACTDAGGEFELRVRPIRGKASAAKTFSGYPVDALIRAIGERPQGAEPVIEWSRALRSRACFVDADLSPGCEAPDFHGDLVPYMHTFAPAPVLWWRSHGGGLRLLYVESDEHTADELAALACVQLARDGSLPFGRYELKTETRHPKGKRDGAECETIWGKGVPAPATTGDSAGIADLFVETLVSPSEVDRWLDRNDMMRGQRYPHDLCPINPSAHGDRNPVLITESGILCFRCAGVGDSIHPQSPAGRVTWASLVGSRKHSLMRDAIDHCVHYGQAGLYLSRLFPTLAGNEILRLAYLACLRSAHPEESGRCQTAASIDGWIRCEGGWMSASGAAYTRSVRETLAALPVAWKIIGREKDNSPKYGKDLFRLGELCNTAPIRHLGYEEIDRVNGPLLWGYRNHYPVGADRVRYQVYSEAITEPGSEWATPELRDPASFDLSLDEAFETLEEVLPGLNREYLLLILAAKGIAESESGMPPFMFATGVSGAGKTSHVEVAAGVAGTTSSSVLWSPDGADAINRLCQHILSGKQKSGFLTFDEVFKRVPDDATRIRLMEFILSLTPSLSFHLIYEGTRPLGRLPAMVWTDVTLPSAVEQSAQIGRRMIRVHLTRRVEWTEPMRNAGVPRFDRIRLRNRETAIACDRILSHVACELLTPSATFESIAESLDFFALSDRTTVEREIRYAIQGLWDAATNGSLRGAPTSYGRGYLDLQLSTGSDLADMWESVADSDDPKRASAIDERDISSVVGASEPVTLDVHRRSTPSRIIFRFVAGDARRGGSVRVNGEIE